MTKRRFASTLLAVVTAVLIASPSEAGQGEPSRIIEDFHLVIVNVMRKADSLGFKGRYAALEPAVRKTYDLPAMASFTAGRYWRDMAEEERMRLVEAFSRMTVATYASRFDGYSGQRFDVLSEEVTPRKLVLVKTQVAKPGKEPIEINYLFRNQADNWRVVDVYLKGKYSELATRRDEYSSVIRKKGVDGLIAALDEKVDELAGKGITKVGGAQGSTISSFLPSGG